MRFLLIGRGKMGRLIQETAAAAGDTVAAALGREDLGRLETMDKVADVVIDFSRPETLDAVCAYVCRTKTPLLSGTTGYTQDQMRRLEAVGEEVPLLWSANFSLGIAVFVRALREIGGILSPDFDIEITETHHNQKADAPSGTAKLLLDAVIHPCDDAGLRPGGELRQAGQAGESASMPSGAVRWPGPIRSASSAPMRNFPSPTGPPAARSSSMARCTWRASCRESPPEHTTCKRSYLENEQGEGHERTGDHRLYRKF